MLIFGFFAPVFKAQTIFDTAYINPGFLRVESQNIPVALFTRTSNFDTADAVFRMSPGETLQLTFINLADIAVEVGSDLNNETVNVPAGETRTLSISSIESGGFGLYAKNRELRYYGLSTVINVAPQNRTLHTWNFRAFDYRANEKIRLGEMPDFENFLPGVFTLNTEVYSLTQMNQKGMVHGSVNDSIYITFAGSNIMYHAPHFHGYHVEIVHSNQANHMIGWSKDSFPLHPDEIITVLLVPHQPGQFPVHDHNLISSTTNGNYPGGIMGMLHIMP